MQVIWTEPALDAIQRAYDYISDFNPAAAVHVADSLRIAGNSLAIFPYRGRPVAGTAMRELVAMHPYIIRYRIDGGQVVILRVRHAARRPTMP